jgi:hypothetical protein
MTFKQRVTEVLESFIKDEDMPRDTAAASIVKAVEEVLPENPYPDSVFSDMSAKELDRASKALQRAGFTLDRLSGSWGRQVWDNYRAEVLRRIKEKA